MSTYIHLNIIAKLDDSFPLACPSVVCRLEGRARLETSRFSHPTREPAQSGRAAQSDERSTAQLRNASIPTKAFVRGHPTARTFIPTPPRLFTTYVNIEAVKRSIIKSYSTTTRMIGDEERIHRCGECGLTLSTRSALTAHARSHRAAADAHKCDVCEKTFAVPARLVRHYRTHTGERPFECEYCHKMFSVKENLQVHRRIHTKERPYRCGVCNAAFEHSGKLHRHARIHTGERPHACPHCQKTFIQSGQLVIHLRTHTGEKPYRCPAPGCGKGFTCSKQLKVHSRTHTGERPYTCDICLRDFGYNHVLKLHRFQHYGERCYRCTVCDGTFNTKKQMEAHIYKEHGAETPRAPTVQPTIRLVSGNVMCDIVEAALQQLPPTPPSSPPSPTSAPDSTPTSTPCITLPSASAVIPTIPPATNLQMTLAHSSLPPRKRKLIPQPEYAPEPVVRHTSVIQFAPALATD